MTLRIAKNFSLPFEAITQTFAILAKRGVGKTYTASVMAEEFLKNGLPVCVIDPTGAWWGLRASADGERAGLPIVVIGGDHGDLPLTVDMGEGLATLLAEQQTPMVIDLSLFTKGEVSRFMTAFGETLYRKNRAPLHLILDEADAFAPQRIMPEQARMVGAIDQIVRRGRIRGLGVTMITQRPAVLNKDVLTQIEVLVALRITAPNDRKAIEAWVEQHGTPEERNQLLNSLASLPIGTAWFWSPGWLEVFQRVEVRQRETFDSSATPKVGQTLQQPHVIAPVDIDALRETLAVEIEKAESGDVTALQRRVAQLQKQLNEKPKVEQIRVEVPVLSDEQMGALQALADELNSKASELIEQAQFLMAFGQDILAVIARTQDAAPPAPAPTRPAAAPPPQPAPAPSGDPEGEEKAISLKDGEISVLKAIAQRYPTRLTVSQIATLAGRSNKSSSFALAMTKMRRLNYITPGNKDIVITKDGLDFLGDDVPQQPQTTEELMSMWQRALKHSTYRLLDLIVGMYPREITKEQLSESSGYSIKSSSFNGDISLLVSNGLVERTDLGLIASDTLFLDGVSVQ